MTGGFPALEDAERLALVETALAKARPDHVIAHIGAPDARPARRRGEPSGRPPGQFADPCAYRFSSARASESL